MTSKWTRVSACFLTLNFLLPAIAVQADDVPAPTQKAGNHSTVATQDGSIRDDELVDFICQQILENGGKVKDVKLMVNACYGGGLLDDMERAFGPGGACAGIPWVGGSAAEPEQTAMGWSDKVVNKYPEDNLGSTWTDGLAGNSRFNENSKAGVIRNGSSSNNVLQDLQATGENDDSGPNGDKSENPQVASGNGGDQIMWNMEGAKHEAIVYGGANDSARHTNNIENVETALENTWPDGSHNIQTFDGGTRQDLFDAIEEAASRLDENTQLVVYIDDHGGSKFDFDEAIGAIANVVIEDPESWLFELPDGWFEGFYGNYFAVPYNYPEPGLVLDITQCMYCSAWGYFLNGLELDFPGGDQTGMVRIPVPFWAILPGWNLLELVPRMPSATQSSGGKPQTHAGSLMVSRMEMSTGPISELEESVLQPGQSAAFYDPTRSGEGLFVELLDNEQALVYMFTYDRVAEGQAWMLGLGRQTGEGIIINEFLMPVGATFGPDFDPADVMQIDFGALAFHLPTCGSSAEPGSLIIYPNGETNYGVFGSGNYVQLTSLVGCESGSGSANVKYSGSWFDPTHNGEGIIIEVLEDGTALVQWFTYDSEGGQMWIQGTGTFNGNTLMVNNLYTTSGTGWGSLFDANDISLDDWGSLTMEFSSCGVATVMYQSTAGFGNGTLNMQRITNLMGIPCED